MQRQIRNVVDRSAVTLDRFPGRLGDGNAAHRGSASGLAEVRLLAEFTRVAGLREEMKEGGASGRASVFRQ
jgi:hypothetical protein